MLALSHRTIETHLMVSGSISFRWFDDAWKILLLLMFILFSLLHNRIVDIFFPQKNPRFSFCEISFDSFFIYFIFLLSIQWLFLFHSEMDFLETKCFAFANTRQFTNFSPDNTRVRANFPTIVLWRCYDSEFLWWMLKFISVLLPLFGGTKLWTSAPFGLEWNALSCALSSCLASFACVGVNVVPLKPYHTQRVKQNQTWS